MKTLFLAAGRSSRMSPIRDKNLLRFGGEPLILKLLKNAAQAGCDDFVVICNEENQETIGDLLSATSLKHQLTTQKNLDEGMAGGILAGLELMDENEDVLVVNGNDYVDPAVIGEVIKAGKSADGAILGQIRDAYFPGGYLEVSGDKVTSIIEKPGEGNEPSNLVNIVIHYFSKAETLKSALDKTSSSNDDIYEVALDVLFKAGEFKAVKYDGSWRAIKYPWHVLEMMDLFLASQEPKVDPSVEIADSALIKGENVVIEAGVKIFENAVIVGPCYIGKNSIIGNNALIRGASIGPNSQIGYNCEVARSWLSGEVTAHIAYIGDSVVGERVNFGAYSCTANLRLDRQTVRVNIKEDRVDSNHAKFGAIIGSGAQIGVGAKLMPGSKADADAHIRPNEVWF